jgi:hypothetical protein
MLDWIIANPLPAALAVLGAVFILWVARPYVRNLLLGAAGAPARVARRASRWLRVEARRLDQRYKARVREHLRQELEERLSRAGRQLEGRVQVDLNRADATLMKLRDSADTVIAAADDADPGKIAQIVIADLKASENGEKFGRGALARAEVRFKEAAREMRSRARSLKPEAQKILSATDKLRLIEHKLSRQAHTMNDAAERYERLVTSEERGRGAGDASIFTPWFAALIVIAIAAAGAVLNFQLIERPMSELVGGGARIAGLSLASLAAITLILLEAAAGIVLMEAAGATQLLPVFRRMSPILTRGFAFAALFFLFVFSTVEVALAFTREAILGLEAGVLRAAAGDAAATAPAEGLPVALVAQALLGFTIPWVLAVVAIPAETVINNTRFVIEVVWKQLLAFAAFIVSIAATALRAVSLALMAVYDLAIFPALAVERLVRAATPRRASKPADEPLSVPAGTPALPPPAHDDLDDEPVRRIAPNGNGKHVNGGAHA